MDPTNSPPKLLIFTRYPTPGKVKTRLIPALGAAGAAMLHKRLTEHVVTEARKLAERSDLTVEIVYADSEAEPMQNWLGEGLVYSKQADGDLGDRMGIAFERAFDLGARKVILIGSDLPDLSEDLLDRAFARLAQADVTLGPATDGGYYLIGLKEPFPDLFAGLQWSTSRVLELTLRKIAAKGKTYNLAPTLNDIDVPEDLRRFKELASDGVSCLLSRLLQSP